jgi:hypothetical protein
VLGSSRVANVLTSELDEATCPEQEQRLRAALGPESEDWLG